MKKEDLVKLLENLPPGTRVVCQTDKEEKQIKMELRIYRGKVKLVIKL